MRIAVMLALLAACGNGTVGTLDAGPPTPRTDASSNDSASDVGAPADARAIDDAATDSATAATDASGRDASGAMDGGGPPDAGPAEVVLAERSGCFHTSTAAAPTAEVPFGVAGTSYGRIRVRLSIELADWRRELFDREVLNHNLVHVYRNAPQSYERYVAGLGAQIRPASPGLQPTTLFFARVDLTMGFASYTTFRQRAPWTTDTTYAVDLLLDIDGRRQILDVKRGGTAFSHVEGDIDYMDRALTTSGFRVELGNDDSADRDVAPLGARFCDLVVTAE